MSKIDDVVYKSDSSNYYMLLPNLKMAEMQYISSIMRRHKIKKVTVIIASLNYNVIKYNVDLLE